MSDQPGNPHTSATPWQRWVPQRLDTPPPPPEPLPDDTDDATPQRPDPRQLEAELNALREAAQSQGHAEGYRAGYSKGIEEGTAEGQQQGHQAGYDAGFTAGHAAGMNAAGEEVARLARLTDTVSQALAHVEEAVGQQLVQLAIRIAERVLHTQLEQHPETILHMVRDIVQSYQHRDVLLTLRVHPDDHDRVTTYLESDPTITHWQLVADPTLQPGDCVAQTPLGTIDATLATQWRRATTALGHPESLPGRPS